MLAFALFLYLYPVHRCNGEQDAGLEHLLVDSLTGICTARKWPRLFMDFDSLSCSVGDPLDEHLSHSERSSELAAHRREKQLICRLSCFSFVFFWRNLKSIGIETLRKRSVPIHRCATAYLFTHDSK